MKIFNIFKKPMREQKTQAQEGVRVDKLPLLILARKQYNPTETLGELRNHNGEFTLVTLEEPWRENKKGVSCIPEGLYVCEPHSGFKFKDVWQVTNVRDRSAILIHSGNTTLDIEGCILVGTKKGRVRVEGEFHQAVLNSRVALESLKKHIGRDSIGRLKPFLLNIINEA